MPPTDPDTHSTPAWTLRYEVLDGKAFGSWRYHLVNADGHAPCGVTGTGSTTATEQAEALRVILGDTAADAAWCPTCLTLLTGRGTGGLPDLGALDRDMDDDDLDRLIAKRHAEDMAWLNRGLRARAAEDDPPADGEPDGPAAWRQRAAEAEALDPDPEGGSA